MDFWSIIPGIGMVAAGIGFGIYHEDIRAWFRWYHQRREDAKGPVWLVGSFSSTDAGANVMAWVASVGTTAFGLFMIAYGVTR